MDFLGEIGWEVGVEQAHDFPAKSAYYLIFGGVGAKLLNMLPPMSFWMLDGFPKFALLPVRDRLKASKTSKHCKHVAATIARC